MKTYNRKKLLIFAAGIFVMFLLLIVRIIYLMLIDSAHYQELADELHHRERSIKAARGRILDRNSVVLADNKTVCTISVIHSQIEDADKVVAVLSKELNKDEDIVRKSVEKVSSRERIATNVEKEIGDRIREYNLPGVKVDEDYKRYYMYDELASKVIGFTGGDNQGVIGLEVNYEEYLAGKPGKILTLTDAGGIELENCGEGRIEPVKGYDLVTSIDYNIQMYATMLAEKTIKTRQAKSVSIIVMDPNNGELLAMASVPEYNLNDPFKLPEGIVCESEKEKQKLLNGIWRNSCVNDTYEPGSTFKMITAAIGLENNIVSMKDTYNCPGYKIVEDRRIRCANTRGHGHQDFTHTVMNSCNPAFIEWGLRIGKNTFFENMQKFGLYNKTGIDVPGEANTIMHKLENVGDVELATISFGQSFQITPIKLIQTAAMLVNGGRLVTPHFGVCVQDSMGNIVKEFEYGAKESIISENTSNSMKEILRCVVDGGGGSRAYIEGYSIGGKTATSEKLPRSANKYIASFVGFAPSEEPRVIAMCIIDEPVGTYYGGTIATPVIKELFENILPYIGVDKK